MDDETSEITNSLNNQLTKKERAYYSGNKKISNNAATNELEIKINFIFEKIFDNEFSKNIVYSGLYDNGVQLLINVLDKNNIGYKLISGRQNTSQKQESVNYYNGYVGGRINKTTLDNEDVELSKYENDKYRVLIITKAGSEGVDTINTNNIFLIEPNWNEATTEQIIARAIRYKSHSALPKRLRFVNVYRLLLVDKNNKPTIDNLFNPEFKDWDIVCDSFKKSRTEQNKLKAEQEGSKKVKNKEAEAIMTKEEKEGYKKLSKEERHTFIMNLEFSRYGVKNDRMALLSGSTPSIDLYIYVLSKSKQKKINDMIETFDTYHYKGLEGVEKHNFSFEDYKNKLTSFLFEEIQKSIDEGIDMTNDMIEEIRDAFINSQVEDLSTELNSDRFIRLEQEHMQQREKKEKRKR
jgi:hypothetical protein